MSSPTELPAPKTITAMEAVRDTPELLELVLSHLPMFDLVCATRVSKDFRALIQKSRTLQRRMFLLPVKEKPQYWQAARAISGGSADVVTVLPDGDQGDAGFKPNPDTEYCSKIKVVSLCPLLQGGFRPDSVADAMFYVQSDAARFSKPVDLPGPFAKSWAEMYLTNPPCTTAKIRTRYTGYGPNGNHMVIRLTRTACSDNGVTLAALWSALSQPGVIRMSWTHPSEHSDAPEHPNEDTRFMTVEDASIEEQVEMYKGEGYDLSWDVARVLIAMYGVVAPSEAERREMKWKGRITSPVGADHNETEFWRDWRRVLESGY